MAEFGIGITTCGRPSTFFQCLATLAANDLSDVDVHVYQDGTICHMTGEARADLRKNEESHAIFLASAMPHKYWYQHELNIGYYLNRFGMLDFLAENYDAFLAIEDDVIVSTHMVTVIRQLVKQFGNDPRVGLISPSQRMLCRPEEREDNWDAVVLNEGATTRLCVEAMMAETWRAIKPNYAAYGKIIGGVPYHDVGISKNRGAVAAWARGLGSDVIEVSGDSGLYRAIRLLGKLRMFLVVNRATNIGDYGINCTPDILRKLGDGHQPIYESEQELNIGQFRIVDLA